MIALIAGIAGWAFALVLCISLVKVAAWADREIERERRSHHPDCEVRRHRSRAKPKHYA